MTDQQRITLDWLAEKTGERGRFVNGHLRRPANILRGHGLADDVPTSGPHFYGVTTAGRALARPTKVRAT